MQKLNFLLLTLFLFVSCKNQDTQETQNANDEEMEVSLSNLQIPVRSIQVRDALLSWQEFQEFENDLKRINQGSIKRFSNETERMVVAVDTLLNTMPENLKSLAIMSRMRVVNTRVKLLHEVLHQHGSDSLDIKKNLEETNIAYTNLMIQIHEKFEKQQIDSLAKTSENVNKNKIKEDNEGN